MVEAEFAVATGEVPVKLIPLPAVVEGTIPSVTAASWFLAHCTMIPV